MSVDLYIKFKDGSSVEHPVGASQTFITHWSQPSQELGLKIIPLLSHFSSDDKEKIEMLVQELITLRDYTSTLDNIEIILKTQLLKRINTTIDLIRDSLTHWEDVEYVSFG